MKRKTLTRFFSILVLIIAFLYIGLIFLNFINHDTISAIPVKEKSSLRIVAANINFGNPNTINSTNILVDLKADIYIILEYTGNNIELSYFKNAGYKIALQKSINSPHGICAIIRDDMHAEGKIIKFPYVCRCQMPFVTLRFNIDGNNLSVWGVHAPPPVPNCKFQTAASIRELNSYFADGYLIKDLGASKRGDFIVLAGDFNIFSLHPVMTKLIQNGLTDTYSDVHFLPSTSWTPFSWIPKFVGLDYIFCSQQFLVMNSFMVNIPGSDHSCVISDLLLPQVK